MKVVLELAATLAQSNILHQIPINIENFTKSFAILLYLEWG